MVLERRARSRGRSSSSSSFSRRHRDRALRVADVDVLKAPVAPGCGELAAPVVGSAGEVVAAQPCAAHVDRAGGRRGDRSRGSHRPACWIENCVSVGPAPPAQVQERLARAVAGEPGLRAVRVEDPQARRRSRARRTRSAAGCRPSRHPCAAAQSRRMRSGVSSNGSGARRGSCSRCRAPATSRSSPARRLKDQIVVVRSGSRSFTASQRRLISPAASAGRAVGEVDLRTRPGACASTSAGVARSCACGASSRRRRRRADPSKPSALRAVALAPCACGAPDLRFDARRRASRSTRASIWA